MRTPRDPDRLIRAFLAEGRTDLADRTYDAVRSDIDRVRQRVVIGSWKEPQMTNASKFAIAAVAVAIAVVAVINVLPSATATVGQAASASMSPSRAAAPHSSRLPSTAEIDPGRYFVPGEWALVQFTLPAGWSSAADGIGAVPLDRTSVTRHSSDGRGFLSLTLSHDVTQVVTDVCVGGNDEQYINVGPTVGALSAAMAMQVERRPSEALAEPTDVMLGGYPAKKLLLTYPNECPGPEGRRIWANGSPGHGAGVLKDATTTIYLVDINGGRQVISSTHRAATEDDLAELDAIVASIAIERAGVHVGCGLTPPWCNVLGPDPMTVEGIPLSFTVPPSGWERFGSISLNKSTHGPQGAEGIIYWTGFPVGAYADPCSPLSSLQADASVADLAAAVAKAPGTELVSGPNDVIVGGHAATNLVVTVREDLGCDPGYFYAWDYSDHRGANWSKTDVGDRIQVWIVDVDGTRLFIAGETHPDASPELAREIQQIVDSIRFE